MKLAIFAAALGLAACTINAPQYVEGDGGGGIDGGADAAPPDGDTSRPRLVLDPDTISVGEAVSNRFTVALDREPEGEVDVAITSGAIGEVTVSPQTVRFTGADWQTPQQITVSALADDDVADEEVEVALRSSDLYEDGIVQVNVNDDDTVALLVSPSQTLDVTEGGTATLLVQLDHQPVSEVTVTIQAGNGAIATAQPTSLQFSPANWDVGQTVTVTGVDDVDATTEDTTLTLRINASSDPIELTVHVTDDDVLGIEPSLTSLGAVREGEGETFTVRLTQEPTGDVVVTAASSDATAVTVVPPSMTFTTSNWETPQTVTVTAVGDVDYADESISISLRSDPLDPRAVALTTDDDDTQAIQLDPATVALTEGGAGQVGVRLAFAPSGSTTVALSSQQPGVATVSTPSLTFDASNYATPQPITVTAVHDNDLVAGTATLRAQILAESLQTDAAVNVTDDDSQVVQSQQLSVVVPEGGSNTIGVRLGFQPTATTTVTVSSANGMKATVNPTSLSFSTSDWNTYKNVTVTGVEDDDVASHNIDITASAPNAAPKVVVANVGDNDTQEIMISTQQLYVTEGATEDLTVNLRYRPSSNVSVTVTPADARVTAPATLTFTPQNFDVPQMLTVTAQHDDDVQSNYNIDVALALQGAIGKTFSVNVSDDDDMHAVFDVAAPIIDERGIGHIGVRLSNSISTPFTPLVYTSNDTDAETVQTELTFTPQNWNQYQTVDIAPMIDDDNEDETFNLVVWGSSQSVLDTLPITIDDKSTYVGSQSGSFPTDQGMPSKLVIAVPFTATANINVERLVLEMPFYVDGSHLSIALYTDVSGRPGARYEVVTGVVNHQHASFALTSPPRLIAAGAKGWLAIVSDAAWTYPKSTSGNTSTQCSYYLNAFSDGLPATFPPAGTAPCAANRGLQVYGVGYAP